MPGSSLTSEQVLTLLAAAPPRIAALTAGLLPSQLLAAPNPGEWSANEVLAHLRACADVWGNCMLTMIAQDKQTLRAVNPPYLDRKDELSRTRVQTLARAFTGQRRELLAVLEPLPPKAWSRTATVTGAGKSLQRTVLFYGQWLVEHERPHIKQIERIVNAMRP